MEIILSEPCDMPHWYPIEYETLLYNKKSRISELNHWFNRFINKLVWPIFKLEDYNTISRLHPLQLSPLNSKRKGTSVDLNSRNSHVLCSLTINLYRRKKISGENRFKMSLSFFFSILSLMQFLKNNFETGKKK